ncbi:MAG TPA: calcium-binding protein [Microcoleus sp.]|nr:calcium-binding protein [Microcoleus sp.]
MATYYGTNGPNNLTGGVPADNMLGAGGNDTLNGGGGNDNIYGDSGNDSLTGGAGLDLMYGGEGDDTFNATGAGNDTVYGGIGNDVYIVNRTTDDLFEGPNQGTDIVRSSVTYNNLDPNVENLVLTGATNINGTGNVLGNQITGNSGNNTLNGVGGNDNMAGGAGNDTLNGGAGNDTLNGGAGNDNMAGGAGNDTLTGGAGIDRFLFNTALPGAGVDRITDFVVGTDKIVLDKTVFAALETVAGNPLLATDFAVINVASAVELVTAGNSSDEIVYNIQTGSLFYNPNNATAGFGAGGGKFATIVGSPNNLSTTDFLVVA